MKRFTFKIIEHRLKRIASWEVFSILHRRMFSQSPDYQTPATVYEIAKNRFSKACKNLSSDVISGNNSCTGSTSQRPVHRLDEFSSIYPLAGCSPTEPVSVSINKTNIENVSQKAN
ncbi:hypothetical protein H8D57_01635 [bacterium]|nr:hypothetical protein [bacterium]